MIWAKLQDRENGLKDEEPCHHDTAPRPKMLKMCILFHVNLRGRHARHTEEEGDGDEINV